MAYVFIICIVIAMLVFFILMIANQDSSGDRNRSQLFKNCLSASYTSIDVRHVPINKDCPSSTKTCPQYDGCDNRNIPFCRNKDDNGDYERISCPSCVDGQWKCDFFVMGNKDNGVANPSNWTQNSSAGDTAQDVINSEFDYCRAEGDDCKFGSFNTGGTLRYSDKGVPSDSKVTGYKVSSSGKFPFFKLSPGHDAGLNLGKDEDVERIVDISLRECIVNAKQPYSYYDDDDDNEYNFNGSYGFVYDHEDSSCNLYKIVDGVSWFSGTSKLVKGG